MSGIGDLFGKNGVVEQLLLWGVVNQVLSALGEPGFMALQQDVLAKHPNAVLSPEVLAAAAVRGFITDQAGAADALKSGVSAQRFATLRQLAQVRISPAELAEAVLRSYVTAQDAQAVAKAQGIDAGELRILTDLAGDAPGPDELAAARRRGLIPEKGSGAASISFEQGIKETRLHDKWAPVVEALSRILLSPADAASATVRNFLSHDQAAKIAAQSGLDAADFATLVHLAGDAPAPGQLAVARRRGLIPDKGTGAASISFQQGIAEGRLANKWADVIDKLATEWPTPNDALDALLKGQVSEAEGKRLYALLGGDMQFFTWLRDSRGNAPTPLEALDMANRGIIPFKGTGANVVSYEQAFLEGPWRNKWEQPYRQLGEYLPPQSTVVTLLSHGAITNQQGAELLKKQGMSDALVSAYLQEAHTEAISDYRGLTVSTVLDAFYASVLDHDTALRILSALHVTPAAAEILLAYTEVRRGFAAVNNAISRVRSLYAARKITKQTARDSLKRLEVPATSIEPMLSAWEVENSIAVKTLTEAQILSAWELQLLSDAECSTELQNIGYTPFDAWVLMSTKAKTPLPNKPAQGPAAPQAQVIPGTT